MNLYDRTLQERLLITLNEVKGNSSEFSVERNNPLFSMFPTLDNVYILEGN